MPKERKAELLKLLKNAPKPLNGQSLAEHFHVTRQIIVQDIALLRADGATILSTNRGYVYKEQESSPYVHRLFKVKHDTNAIESELLAIVDNGGRVQNIQIDHPVYGEIQTLVKLTCRRDVQHFLEQIQKEDYAKINKRSKVDVGDVLMPMIGTVGNPIIVNTDKEFAIKNVALIKFKDDSVILNTFIKTLLESDYFGRAVLSKTKGGTQKFISLGDIRKLEFNLPPIELQHRFATFVAQVDKSKFALVKSIKLLKKSPFDILLGLL